MREGRSLHRGLARRELWPQYLGGMVTEVIYIAVLMTIGFAIALLAGVIF